MDDRRKTPRKRLLKEGKIVYADGLRVLDCTIRDMSAEGARLLIANTVKGKGVPYMENIATWHGSVKLTRPQTEEALTALGATREQIAEYLA